MTYELPKLTDEQALSVLVSFLKGERKVEVDPFSVTGDDLYIPHVIGSYLQHEHKEEVQARANQLGPTRTSYDLNVNAGPFYAAASILCRRGIIFPSWQPLSQTTSR